MTDFVLVPGSFTGAWIWREVADRLTQAGATAHPVTLTGMGPGAAVDVKPVAEAPEDTVLPASAPTASVHTGGDHDGEVAAGGVASGGVAERNAEGGRAPHHRVPTSQVPTDRVPANPVPVGGASADPVSVDSSPIDLETHIAEVVALIDRLDAKDLVLVGHDYGILPVLAAATRRPDRISRVVNVDTAPPQDGVPAIAVEPDPTIRELALSTATSGGAVGPPAAEAWQVRGSVPECPKRRGSD
ncbi:alpha/beta fold hydrolase [uncultured Streptomyces sp.]|uniref:alpha/beta fold hydrolase n=1 Tax=uncultured Streptomyces sp. TaxID=174707 RepID=UPI002618D486|nr:alpha/beta hydrolase [uncultured Streptomyces sp.]